MHEHDLQPKRRRRYVATTDSDHDSPISPDRARDVVPVGPDQLWVADITYIAITTGFVYLAAKRSVKICFGHALTSQRTRRATTMILTLRPEEGKSAAVLR